MQGTNEKQPDISSTAEEKSEEETGAQSPAPVQTSGNGQGATIRHMSVAGKLTLGAIIVAVLFVGGLIGYGIAHGFQDDQQAASRRTREYALRDDQSGRNGGNRWGADGTGGGWRKLELRDNDSISVTRLNGVVTAVNGDTLTVAGNGRVRTVKLTDATVYEGASKPAAVNDTIIAVGTESEDVLTATAVRLVRQ